MTKIIADLPKTVDPAQSWLVDGWAARFGVSSDGVRQAINIVGRDSSKVRKHLNDGVRIAVRDSSGVLRLGARLTTCNGGFGISVPYHSAKNGWLYKSPYFYGRGEGETPLSEFTHYTVNDHVKLSLHMEGFVQFSGAGGKPIISGFNKELQQAKGLGLKMHGPSPMLITTGPLFTVTLYGLQEFRPLGTNHAEIFEPSDFWHHPKFSGPEDTAYHLEFFMFPRSLLVHASIDQGNRLLKKEIETFKSKFRFQHEFRVIEFPGLDIFLGLMICRFPEFQGESGYMIAGPGTAGPGEEQMYGIGARYPCPDMIAEHNPTCLDLLPPRPEGEA